MKIIGIGWWLAACGVLVAMDDPRTQVPGFDAARIGMSHSAEADLGTGELDMTRYELSAFLSVPTEAMDGWYVLPHFSYELTSMDFSGLTGPFQDEDLHSVALDAYVISMNEGSPWIFGGWARAELASDFQSIDGDDFSFDVALGAAYRINDAFTLGVGVAVTNLNGDETIYPGIAFDWVVNEQLRIGAYGPMVAAAYTPNDDWLFSLRMDFTGGVWNITDNTGNSRMIDLSDNRLGLYASRRLGGDWWLTGGVGVTLGNELDYETAGGRTLWSTEPDSAIFGMIGVRLKAW